MYMSITTHDSHRPVISANIRDASFSSCLDGPEENFKLKLATPKDHTIFLVKTEPDDKELDVFDAEKYFNEPNHSPTLVAENISTRHPKKDDPMEIFVFQEQQPLQPYNSRSSLLHTPPENRQHLKKDIKKSFLATISCNFPCADKYSIDVDDRTVEKQSNESYKINHLEEKFDEPGPNTNRFNFPVFDPVSVNQASKMKIQVEENIITQRSKFLQVIDSWNACSDLEKKLTVAAWDAIRPGILTEEIEIPSISSGMENDTDNDAVSDLFETERFSKDNPFLFRQATDGCKSPTTCYAPSEASIEWSVVTASAADYPVRSDIRSNSRIGGFEETPKLGSGKIWDCNSRKAVRVDGDHNSYTYRFERKVGGSTTIGKCCESLVCLNKI